MDDKEGEAIFRKLETQLHRAIEHDRLWKLQNDAKLRAVQQTNNTYEDFKNIVAAAHLQPLKSTRRLSQSTNVKTEL
ncbi:hypothetical protein CHUAL_010241 [Chamberlinius hualienensis]